ncbi:MAG TPA: hypothetical protein VLJ68_09050 [Chitinophagaceae bacterium]|nr:hypothetical protein [Chitinophagaceae bacterium]
MEVHQHTHTPRKKWTHYLWEFLMLFLAIFCGFLAENKREHIVEQQREKRFMKNMLEDLTRDTASIERHAFFQKRAVLFSDSLVTSINSPGRNDHLKDIYYYVRILSIFNPFFYSNATISQLKNSGSLRLIGKGSVADSIIQYDMWAQRMLAVEGNIETVIGNFRACMGNLIDAQVIKSMIDTSLLTGTGPARGNFIKRPLLNYPLISDDKKNINQLCMYADFLLTLYQYQFKNMETQKERAIRLIKLLKKEYRLNNKE